MATIDLLKEDSMVRNFRKKGMRMKRLSKVGLFLLAICLVIASMSTPMAKGTDVPTSHWAYDPIKEAMGKGIVSGYPDGTFRPNNEVTFAEFIKMAAVVSLGQDPGPSKIGNWFDGYKATAESQGLLDGLTISTADMSKAISRYHVALILANSIPSKEITARDKSSIMSSFTDLKNMAKTDSLAIVVKEELMAGYPDGTFRPANFITRAEAVAVILRMMQKMESDETACPP